MNYKVDDLYLISVAQLQPDNNFKTFSKFYIAKKTIDISGRSNYFIITKNVNAKGEKDNLNTNEFFAYNCTPLKDSLKQLDDEEYSYRDVVDFEKTVNSVAEMFKEPRDNSRDGRNA